MPKWRPFTWVILVVNPLFLIWLIVVLVHVSGSCSDETGLAKDVCDALSTIGASIGAVTVLFVWFLVDGILGILWFVTRQEGRFCAVCGTRVKAGITTCPACGYDFRASTGGSPAVPPPGK
jgi:hypothetical protein